MENIYSSLADASPRRRAGLRPLFREYATIKDVQRHIGEFELKTLFEGIITREKTMAKIPLSGMISKEYADEWLKSFIDTVASYRDIFLVYDYAVAEHDRFWTSIPAEFATKINERDKKSALPDQLAVLQEGGYGASFLGRMEAHGQIRRILQIMFARYSYDRRDAMEKRDLRNHNDPAPNRASYNQRVKLRANLTGNHGIVDQAIGLALYLDAIHKSAIDKGHNGLPIWANRTRSLYTRQILLMPGIEQSDYAEKYVQYRYKGDSVTALHEMHKAEARWPDIVDELRPTHKMVSLGNTTLCLMNQYRGYFYTHASLEGFEPNQRIPDVYSIGEINFDWKSISDLWEAQAAEVVLPTRNPSCVAQGKRQQRVDRALKKLSLIEEELRRARAQFMVDERKEARKAERAELRRIANEAHRMAAETREKTAREAEKRSEENAQKTRMSKRESAKAERMRLLALRDEKRNAEKVAAEAHAEKNKAQIKRIPSDEEMRDRARTRIMRKRDRKQREKKKRHENIQAIRKDRKFRQSLAEKVPKPK